jgi:acyl dehydratase
MAKSGYTYEDLHPGMAFRSPGRTITEADIVAFAGMTRRLLGIAHE